MRKNEFIASNSNPAIAEAIIKQSGGWNSFKESAIDVALYGADSGFSGFIYYHETIAFFDANKKAILGLLSSQARDFGTSVVDMVAGFSCLSDIDKSDIEAILFGFESSDECAETQVKNALAWFALETVCLDYAYCVDA